MDEKDYIALKNGCYAVSQAQWDADTQKRADNFQDGSTLYIYTDGDYEGGCQYAFSKSQHWYLF